jgi:hypothetical protein
LFKDTTKDLRFKEGYPKQLKNKIKNTEDGFSVFFPY